MAAGMQTAIAMQAMGGGGMMGGGFTAPANPFEACQAPPPPADFDEDDDDDGMAKPPAAAEATYYLRICTHSGVGFPNEASYVKIIIGEGQDDETTDISGVAVASTSPVWEYAFEKKITISGQAPDVEIQVWASRVLADVLLAACKLKVPDSPTDGPKRQKLKMRAKQDGMSQILGMAPLEPPKLLIVWQLCELEDAANAPDLSRIAEMDASCTVKKYWNFMIQANNVRLRVATKKPEKFRADFSLIDAKDVKVPGGFTVTPEIMSGGVPSDPKKEKPEKKKNEAVSATVNNFLNWGETADEGFLVDPWRIYQNEINLRCYFIRVRLFHQAPGAASDAKKDVKWTQMGLWEESVGDVLDALEEKDQKLFFDADVVKDNFRVGLMSLDLDIYNLSPHKENLQRLNIVENKEHGIFIEPPVRIGWHKFRGPLGKHAVTYHVNCWADGLPTHKDKADPFIRIKMGRGAKGETETKSNEFFQVSFQTIIKLKTVLNDRKAVIEMWDHNWGGNWMFGEISLYSVEPDKLLWCQCYGGAFGAPNEDIASAMVKGANRPPSTYHGSLAIMFSIKEKKQKDFEKLVQESMRPKRLCVRLYKGLYLPEKFYGKKVSVVVQVAGGFIPHSVAVQEIMALRKKRDDKQMTPEQCVKAVHDVHVKHSRRFNRNVLSFPGVVNSRGVLRFVSMPGDTMENMSPQFSWIQRSTPRTLGLDITPGTSHCYLYVVVEGEEEMPPELFARYRILEEGDACLDDGMAARSENIYNILSKPKWKRIRKDESVCQIAESDHAFAGYILGQAVTIPFDPLRAPGEPPSDLDMSVPEKVIENYRQDKVESPFVNKKEIGKTFTFFTSAMELDAQTLYPNPAKPGPLACRTCVDDRYVMKGNLGDQWEWLVGRKGTEQTIYAHIDVICCRSLVATDDDGLCDPCYKIQVEDKILTTISNEYLAVPKSLNPTFMHRLIVPLTVEINGNLGDSGIPKEVNPPLPPVVFNLLDKDSTADDMNAIPGMGKFLDNVLGDLAFKVITNTIAVTCQKHPSNLDSLGASGDYVDVNKLHRANWHALDKPFQRTWNPMVIGDAVLMGRPRVLMAVGFSRIGKVSDDQYYAPTEVKNEKDELMGTMGEIQTQVVEYLEIELDMLGLRNVPMTMYNPELVITSFWPGKAISFDIDVNETQCPNFRGDQIDKKRMHKFAESVQALIRIREKKSGKKIAEDEDKESSIATSIELADLVGARIGIKEHPDDKDTAKPIFYPAPVIPYLQPPPPKKIAIVVTYDKDAQKFDLRIDKENMKIRPGETWETVLDQKLAALGLDKRITRRLQFECCGPSTPGAQGKNIVPYFGEFPLALDKTRDFPLTITTREELDPVLIMPDVVFQMRSRSTGMDYGTFSIPFPRPPLKGEEEMTWVQLSNKEFDELDPDRQKLAPVKNVIIDETAYGVFVDVFAAKQGYLMWDDDFFLGRALRSPKIFTVYENEDDQEKMAAEKEAKNRAKEDGDNEDDEEYDDDQGGGEGQGGKIPAYPCNQFFNPSDWMAGDPAFDDEPFDTRVMPGLHCGTYNPKSRDWTSTRDKKEPMRRDDLFSYYLGWAEKQSAEECAKTGVVVIQDKADLANLPTRKITHRLEAANWRCKSHQHAPEHVEDIKNPQPSSHCDIDEETGEHTHRCLDKNLHTFMRPVGHRISRSDRSSRFLCRFRMGLPKAALGELEKAVADVGRASEKGSGAGSSSAAKDVKAAKQAIIDELCDRQENLVNFMVIKFNRPGTIIWSAHIDKDLWRVPGRCLFVVKLQNGGDHVSVTVPSFDLRYPKESSWFPVKTFHERWQTLRNRINKERIKREQKAAEAKEKAKAAEADGGEIPKMGAQKSSLSNEPEPALKNVVDHKLKLERDQNFAHSGPDGTTLPVWVHKHAFVCRIRKKMGSNSFDRQQSVNWYRSVLDDVFPEVRDLGRLPGKIEDYHMVRDMFFNRFLNFRCNLLSGENATSFRGVLKGHFRVKKAELPDDEKRLMDAERDRKEQAREAKIKADISEKEEAKNRTFISSIVKTWSKTNLNDVVGQPVAVAEKSPSLYLPVSNLWRLQSLNTTVYVLTAGHIRMPPGFTKITFQLSASCGSSKAEKPPMEEMSEARIDRGVELYEIFNFSSNVPGENLLTVTLTDYATGTPIGKCTCDLEDRWLTLLRRQTRSTTNRQFIDENVYLDSNVTFDKTPDGEYKPFVVGLRKSEKADFIEEQAKRAARRDLPKQKIRGEPLKERDVYWLDEPGMKKYDNLKDAPGSAVQIKPKLGPQERMPIEIRDMIVEDEDTGTETKSGFLRMWVDVRPDTAEYALSNLAVFNETFQIHIVIDKVKDITIFKDLGERNDCYIEGKLKVKDFDGETKIHVVHTDVHKWSTGEASFNWQWVFQVKAPPSMCSLKLGIMDNDLAGDSDPIYTPKDYALDHFIMLACLAKRDGQPNLGTLHEVLTFDDWPGKREGAKKPSCLMKCCACCCGRRITIPKPAKMHMSVSILPVSDAPQLENGVCVKPPTGRLTWSTAVTNPGLFFTVMIGPSNKACCIRMCLSLCLCVLLLGGLAGFYFASQGMAGLNS